MEQFSDLIKNRRSMRKFTDQELTQEEVVALLKAALMAPSSKRSNCWQFIVVDDKDMLEKLSHCKEMGAAFLLLSLYVGGGFEIILCCHV